MKILITDGLSPDGVKILTDAGFQVDNVKLTPEELLEKIGDYDSIIVRSATKVTKEVIEAGKNLKVIARGGVGVDGFHARPQHRLPLAALANFEFALVHQKEGIIRLY